MKEHRLDDELNLARLAIDTAELKIVIRPDDSSLVTGRRQASGNCDVRNCCMHVASTVLVAHPGNGVVRRVATSSAALLYVCTIVAWSTCAASLYV